MAVDPALAQQGQDLAHAFERLVESGNTVITVEHDMDIIAASDWVIDIGPGAGEEGGQIVAAGTPRAVAASQASRTAPYIRSLAA
jgi:excinuclease ABC subunit A